MLAAGVNRTVMARSVPQSNIRSQPVDQRALVGPVVGTRDRCTSIVLFSPSAMVILRTTGSKPLAVTVTLNGKPGKMRWSSPGGVMSQS